MKTLTITINVTDLTDAQIGDLAAEMESQAEAAGDRPEADVLSRVVA
jgi:hypothetical protein